MEASHRPKQGQQVCTCRKVQNGNSVLPFLSKPNLVRFPLILSEYKARQKDQALAQASPKVEASHRPKQGQQVSTCRKVQNGNCRVHQDLPDSRGMVSSIDLSDACLHIPIHPNSRKYLRFCYKSQVFQFTSLPFGLATAPPGIYNDCKGSEANGPLKRTQTSPIPGRLAD